MARNCPPCTRVRIGGKEGENSNCLILFAMCFGRVGMVGNFARNAVGSLDFWPAFSFGKVWEICQIGVSSLPTSTAEFANSLFCVEKKTMPRRPARHNLLYFVPVYKSKSGSKKSEKSV